MAVRWVATQMEGAAVASLPLVEVEELQSVALEAPEEDYSGLLERVVIQTVGSHRQERGYWELRVALEAACFQLSFHPTLP